MLSEVGYNHCPDEKGTERRITERPSSQRVHGYNHCPDEKGTESIVCLLCAHPFREVTTIAPMKRGLKVPIVYNPLFSLLVTTIAPMKRGLKGAADAFAQGGGTGYNHCPDEKGTERLRGASISLIG